MSLPPAIFRKPFLYSIIPELEQIDLNMRFYNYNNSEFSNIQAQFQTELSNVTVNNGDLLEFYTSFSTMMYINALEATIINSNAATGTDLLNLFVKKISLLEDAVSLLSSP